MDKQAQLKKEFSVKKEESPDKQHFLPRNIASYRKGDSPKATSIGTKIPRSNNPRGRIKLSARVFGVDHSPWAQIVVQAFTSANIPTELSCVPTFRTTRQNAFVYPCVELTLTYPKDSNEVIKLEEFMLLAKNVSGNFVYLPESNGKKQYMIVISGSFQVLRMLERLSLDVTGCVLGIKPDFEEGKKKEYSKFNAKLEELFFQCAFERSYGLNIYRFPILYARTRESHEASTWQQTVLRGAFKALLYIKSSPILLIFNISYLFIGQPRVICRPYLSEVLRWFEGYIPETGFISKAKTPGSFDFALFGMMQFIFCGLSEIHASHIVQQHGKVCRWVVSMNGHCKSPLMNLLSVNTYSLRVKEVERGVYSMVDVSELVKSGKIAVAPFWEQVVFGVVVLVALVFFPVLTLIWIVLAQVLNRFAREASARRLTPGEGYWGTFFNFRWSSLSAWKDFMKKYP